MERSETNWLNIAVFYTQEEWHILLTNCIAPLLKEVRQEKMFDAYLLYLSNERGDNVQLSLLTGPARTEHLLNTVSAAINDFLAKHRSSDKEKTYPLPNLFMDFPNNSVRYNLHKPRPAYPNNEMPAEIQHFISDCIVHVLGQDVIDQDSLITFFIYTLLKIVKIYYPELEAAEQRAAGLVTAKHDYIDLYQDSFFEGNEEALLAICYDVWGNSKEFPELYWLIECERVIKPVTGRYKLEEFMPMFLQLLLIHLGIRQGSQKVHSILVAMWKTLCMMKQHEN